MTKTLFWLGFCVIFVAESEAFAAFLRNPVDPLSTVIWCNRGDGAFCSPLDGEDLPGNRTVVVIPTGFTADDYALFKSEFERLIANLSTLDATVYTTQHRSRLRYLGLWVPGGELTSEDSSFGGKVFAHPIRGKALTVDQAEVISTVNSLLPVYAPSVKPWAVIVLFNTTETGITANASPPTFIQNPYGIAKITRADLDSSYVPTHELAHAALNFVDEYIEGGFENMSVQTLDILTPWVLFNGTWKGFRAGVAQLLGFYSLRLSEVLAANGSENVDVTKTPSRVRTENYAADPYVYEGGMFFGKGTYHHAGKNLMGSGRATGGPEDGFAYDHSKPQREVIVEAFGTSAPASRPNDRIRNAGPDGSWPAALGGQTQVLLFDGDKMHHYHPTLGYDVQVGWYERHWKQCWWKWIPYPCVEDIWTTAEKNVPPDTRTIDLTTSRAYGLATLLQTVLCRLGVKEIPAGSEKFSLCEQSLDQVTAAFLPTVRFPMPYQEVSVPASQWMTKYYWRFRTRNSNWVSGWTGWSTFVRVF